MAKGANTRAPNIVLICSDQHRADTIGAYGSQLCRTPNLDRLAANGVLMERCYAQNPVCGPSRATMFTGLESHHHGVRTNGLTLSPDTATLPSVLRRAGYRTAAIGKTHLSPQMAGVPGSPHFGFDHIESCEDNRVGLYLDWALKNFPEHEGYLLGTLFNLPSNEEYWTGRRDLRKEHLRARERFVKPLEISGTCNWGFGHYSPLPEEAHHNTWITDRAIAQLDSPNDTNPLFLWAGYVEPHNPFDPPKRFREMYRWEEIAAPLGLETDESKLPVHTRALRKYFRSFTDRDHRILRALYFASVTFLDEQIGRLLDAIEQRLDMQNTILVYTSDHGEILGDHGIYGKSAYHYDPGIHVPFIARWDGRWQRGARCNGIVELTDLMPTLLDAAGVATTNSFDGNPFTPSLVDAALASSRDHAFIESYSGAPEDPTPPPLGWAKTIRSDRWRATFYPAGNQGELYDLMNDRKELQNLWLAPDAQRVIDQHREILRTRFSGKDEPLPRRKYPV